MALPKKRGKAPKKLIILTGLIIFTAILITWLMNFLNKPKIKIDYSKDISVVSIIEKENYEKTLTSKNNDIFVGSPSAPVIIIAYDSFSCLHCAKFYSNIFPQLKAEYIDTGKVKFIHRDFPLNGAALYISKLVKCYSASNSLSQTFNMILSVYSSQNEWLDSNEYQTNISTLFSRNGFTNEAAKACEADEIIENFIIEERLEAMKNLHLKATPSFFIHNKELKGGYSFENFKKHIDNALTE